jgi:hypothetical protein
MDSRGPLLGGIVRIDPDIFGGEVGGKKLQRMPPPPQLHSNIADRLGESPVRFSLIKFAANPVAAYFLTANKNLDTRRIDRQAAPSDRR